MQLDFGCANCSSLPPLVDVKFDMEEMKELVAIWAMMHNQPFIMVEEEGFNMFCKGGMLEWESISRTTLEKNCFVVYEMEKKRLKRALKSVDKLCLTIKLWKSKSQKLEYMVITGQWVDSNWNLNKRVLNFFRFPPPHNGISIADAVSRCTSEWEIKDKVLAVLVDNASTNDDAIDIMRDSFNKASQVCDGKLFHVGCTAHILNLIAQDGLHEIRGITAIIRESINFIRKSKGRELEFAKVAEQLNLPNRKLIVDRKTRWNSTYEMLGSAFAFKEVFAWFQVREPSYVNFPTDEDWKKIEKVIKILKVMCNVTHIISGSNYPTSNLFFIEVVSVKSVLDGGAFDEDDFVRGMACKMKTKFDKYWGETNMLMTIGAIMDPRCKLKILEVFLPQLHPEEEVQERCEEIKRTLFKLYSDYCEMENAKKLELSECKRKHQSTQVGVRDGESSSNSFGGLNQFNTLVRTSDIVIPMKDELDVYLEERRHDIDSSVAPSAFNALLWWHQNSNRFPTLSITAKDILAVPLTTASYEGTFSAGSRVIDKYCARLAPKTMEMLLCGGDWLRAFRCQ